MFTFHIERDPDTGEIIYVFRNIGTHDIYRRPGPDAWSNNVAPMCSGCTIWIVRPGNDWAYLVAIEPTPRRKE